MKKQKNLLLLYQQLIQAHNFLQVEVQTNTEVVKNDDAVIDGQDETNNKLGFLGKTFQKISTFLKFGKTEKKESDQKQENIFNKIGGFLKEKYKKL